MFSRRQLETELFDLRHQFYQDFQKINVEAKQQEIERLDKITSESNIWSDVKRAQSLIQELQSKRDFIQPWLILKIQLDEYKELLEISDSDLIQELGDQLTVMKESYQALKRDLIFTGKYDSHNVILRLTSGVGGLDAQDFVGMLERMYLRYFKKIGFKVKLLERQPTKEGGVTTAVYQINGQNAYGKLQGEHGVHRLVRLSPFNSDNLRQTSFVLVEILPEISAEQVEIKDADLRIDYFRAGGHGGQSVNTTDSAVRITHLPTGLVVSIQNERSQIQNKATAMSILYSKLITLQESQKVKDLQSVKANESAGWGSQIRNYIMHPYTLVKDTRTKYQESDVKQVLNGDLDSLINSYLDTLL